MKTKNKLELTENQKKILLNTLLRELQSINDDISKYAFDKNISEPLKEHKEKVYEIYQLVNASMEEK